MTATDHDALRDSAGLYVLGALDAAEREAFEAHLVTCAECGTEVRALRLIANALPYALPQLEPSPALRRRVLADVGLSSHAPSSSADIRTGRAIPGVMWLAIAAMLALVVALGGYAVSLRQRLGGLQDQLAQAIERLDRSDRQLAEATLAVEGARVRMAVLTAPDLKQVTLAGQPIAARATGRAFWSPSTGLLFAAADLPALPAGRTYQLWLLRSGANPPVSAGIMKPDQAGRIAEAFAAPRDVAAATGVAVSIEPDGGVPAPTGDLYLVGSSQ